MIKTGTWIKIIAAVFAVSLTAAIVSFFMPTGGKIANIYVDGECIRSVDLSDVSESFEFDVETPAGTNRIRVEKGRICVISADCPDEVCVKTSWIGDSSMPIVCLPHRLVIKIEKQGKAGSGEFDAAAR